MIETLFLLQDGIAGYLTEEMMREGLELDQMDLSGDTPLHLAAKAGRTKTAVTFLNLGASVNMKVHKLSWYYVLLRRSGVK